MERLITETVQTLVNAALVSPDAPLVGGVDDAIVWNQCSPETAVLSPLFRTLNIAALVLSRPKEPYGSILDYLILENRGVIKPEDTETRTFLHDIEILNAFSTETLGAALGRRKGVILPGGRIAAAGAISPLQAYLNFSSVCFACLVTYLITHVRAHQSGELSDASRQRLAEVVSKIPSLPVSPADLMRGPFESVETVHDAMIEAGGQLVRHRLVDSLFGNISYRFEDTLYISQTGSALDRLAGNIDPAPLDNRSSAIITASSELSAHLQIVRDTSVRAILHGHPPFAVVVSLDCDREDCNERGRCHLHCPAPRRMADIPIIPGEVGTGPTGLSTTLPPAIEGKRGVIVYGHGVFTVGDADFNAPFEHLMDIEKHCRRQFLERTGLR